MRYELGFWKGDVWTVVETFGRRRTATQHGKRLTGTGQACAVWDTKARSTVWQGFAL